jgi:hypothetical protein
MHGLSNQFMSHNDELTLSKTQKWIWCFIYRWQQKWSPILYQNWHGWFNKKSSDGPESVNQYFKMSSTTEQCSTLDHMRKYIKAIHRNCKLKLYWIVLYKVICLSICKSRLVTIFAFVLALEIQLSREEGWDPVNWFNPTTFLCLYQTRIMIFWCQRSYVVFSVIHFVDIVKLLSITV